MSDAWTIQRTLAWCREYLERHGDENPRLSSEWLLCAATGMSRVELYAYFDRPLTMEERDVLRDSLRRRGAGEPLQYIGGEAAFRHLVLKTRRGVLIPRPETELLVQIVLDALGCHGTLVEVARSQEGAEHADEETEQADTDERLWEYSGPQVLEVGTGTGCIALSLAKEACVQVTATDVSAEAVECATRNRDALGLEPLVRIVETDCVAGIDGTFDALVSNPPYIPANVMSELPREVSAFEPHLALYGGADGLEFFDRLVTEALPLLKPGALFACELHEESLDEAAGRLRAKGLTDVEVKADLAGRPRFVCARR